MEAGGRWGRRFSPILPYVSMGELPFGESGDFGGRFDPEPFPDFFKVVPIDVSEEVVVIDDRFNFPVDVSVGLSGESDRPGFALDPADFDEGLGDVAGVGVEADFVDQEDHPSRRIRSTRIWLLEDEKPSDESVEILFVARLKSDVYSPMNRFQCFSSRIDVSHE